MWLSSARWLILTSGLLPEIGGKNQVSGRGFTACTGMMNRRIGELPGLSLLQCSGSPRLRFIFCAAKRDSKIQAIAGEQIK